ncbi:hypothetical protein CC79DRAFT_1360527 [Sarocladium strictum]
MHFSQSFLAVAIPALAAALPTGEIEHNLEDRQCTGCAPPPKDLQPSYCPVIDSEENFTDPEWQAGVSTKSGNTLQFAQTYTQGSSWTIGGSLGLDFAKIIEGSASLSAEVTESVEHSVMVGSETSCPEGGKFSCSLLIYPGMKRVKGNMVEIGPTENCAAGIHAQEGIRAGLLSAFIYFLCRKSDLH